VLGGSEREEAVHGVWSCLVPFRRQSRWHVDTSSSLYEVFARSSQDSCLIRADPTDSRGDASTIRTRPLYPSQQLFPLTWFQSLIFVCSRLSTSRHFLAVSIPARRYPCLLPPPSVDVEAGYCQHWPPGVQEMPRKRLSQIRPV
jgi:hypothetical protein